MKLTQTEIKRIAADIRRDAAQLERTAAVLLKDGPRAVKLAEDWEKSPLRAAGMDPGRGKGGHADPTAMAAGAFYDSAGEQLAFLTAEVYTAAGESGRSYKAAAAASERVLNILRVKVTDDERKGTGYCSCGTLCDGKQRRLRDGLCPSCDQAERRARNSCAHDKQVWHDGVRTCCACKVELSEAGLPV